MSTHDTVDTWLKSLEKALMPLPEADRADILQEARAHIHERTTAGQSLHDVLNGFGAPETYARPFVDDHELNQALATHQTLPLIKGLFLRTRSGLTAILGLGCAAFFAYVMFLLVLNFADKLGAPKAVGLWRDSKNICIGHCLNHPQTPEILGNWYYVILIALFVACGFLGHLGLRLAGIAIVRKKTPRR